MRTDSIFFDLFLGASKFFALNDTYMSNNPLTIEKKKKMTKREIKTPIDFQWCVIFFFLLLSLFETLLSFRFILYIYSLWMQISNNGRWREEIEVFCWIGEIIDQNTHIVRQIYTFVCAVHNTQHETHCGKNDHQRFDAMNSN